MSHSKIREECCAANRELAQSGLVDLTFGNVSVWDPERELFTVKPSGVPYSQLTVDDMVVLDLQGNVVYGQHRPSSDTPTHRALYLGFAGSPIRSVVHTHSRNAVSFAQAGQEIPCMGTTHADHFDGPVPVTRALSREETEKDYEWNTGQVIRDYFAQKDPTHIPAILVRHHGPFAWGESATKALENAMALEVVADMAIKTRLLEPTTGSIPDHLRLKHFLRKHGPEAYYGQP